MIVFETFPGFFPFPPWPGGSLGCQQPVCLGFLSFPSQRPMRSFRRGGKGGGGESTRSREVEEGKLFLHGGTDKNRKGKGGTSVALLLLLCYLFNVLFEGFRCFKTGGGGCYTLLQIPVSVPPKANRAAEQSSLSLFLQCKCSPLPTQARALCLRLPPLPPNLLAQIK